MPALQSDAYAVVVRDGPLFLTTLPVRQGALPDPTTLQIQDTAKGYGEDLSSVAGLAVAARMYKVDYRGQPHTMTPLFSGRVCPPVNLATGDFQITWQLADFATVGTYELDLTLSHGSNVLSTTGSLLITVDAEA